jgi:hypothetical protein
MSYSGAPNYQDPLAGSDLTFGVFTPFQLWAGDPGWTTDETFAQFGLIQQFTVMGRRADGKIVPLLPYVQDGSGGVAAKALVTFTAQPAVNDTLTVNGTVITFIANGAVPVGNQVPLGATFNNTAEATSALINSAVANIEAEFNGVANTIELVADAPGTAGNAYTLAKTSAGITISGATFAGGSATTTEASPESKPIGVAAQPIDTTMGDVQGPVLLGGTFNYAALIWPDSVTTLAQMKALTDGTKMAVRALK